MKRTNRILSDNIKDWKLVSEITRSSLLHDNFIHPQKQNNKADIMYALTAPTEYSPVEDMPKLYLNPKKVEVEEEDFEVIDLGEESKLNMRKVIRMPTSLEYTVVLDTAEDGSSFVKFVEPISYNRQVDSKSNYEFSPYVVPESFVKSNRRNKEMINFVKGNIRRIKESLKLHRVNICSYNALIYQTGYCKKCDCCTTTDTGCMSVRISSNYIGYLLK